MRRMLTDRNHHILRELIELYTQTGEPVGSKALVEHAGLELSSATIRNIMAELEEGGFLASPHTSAGRVPTEAGYRYYAKGLVEVKGLEQRAKSALQQAIGQAPDLQRALQQASSLLGELTGCASLVLTPTQANDPLETLDFIRLEHGRVLVVLVSRSGQVENRMIQVPVDLAPGTLEKAAQQLNEVVRGLTIPEALERVVQALQQHRSAADALLDQLMTPSLGFQDSRVVVSGSQRLFNSPALMRDQLAALAQVFEEKRLLYALLNEVKNSAGVQIFVGADCPLAVAKDCTMITAPYASQDHRVVGTVGVIGPMRMNYQQSVAAVDYTAKLLSTVLNRG